MKKLDKRLLVLNIAVVAVIIFSFVYVWSVGDDYTLHTHVYPDKGIDNVVVDVKNDNVVEFINVRAEDDEMVIDFRGDERGETRVLVTYDDDNGERATKEYLLETNEFDTVVDHTDGIISFNGMKEVVIAIICLLVLVEIIMLWMFFDYRKKGLFSYPMIAFGGVAIYNLALLGILIFGATAINSMSLTYLFAMIVSAGVVMLMVLFPLMLILSILLAISNIWLMHHEGYRPVNALGIFFAILWFLGSVATIGALLGPSPTAESWYAYVEIALVYIIGYFECMFIATVVCSFLAAKFKTPLDRDYIIILGCAVRKDGSLTPLLKGRVDSAIAFEKKQYDATGKHAVFVPSGGQGADESISEGEAMEQYLKSVDVPAERIAREDKSTNTFENMKFSKEVIDEHAGGKNKKIAFATTNYHVFRGYIMAKKNGYEVKGISAKTKPYFFPNAFLREFVGLLVDQKWKHFAAILALAALFLAIAYMVL